MKAFTYIKQGEFGFTEKEKPTMIDAHDAIVRVTLSSICTPSYQAWFCASRSTRDYCWP